MTTSPNADQFVAGSTTLSPVTQTADVAVKRAVTNELSTPGSEANGRRRSRPPSRLAPTNATTTY